tara:strand:- start:150 stop:449 length:300 start_codon:yes stop_codon:yes gene_type:complete
MPTYDYQCKECGHAFELFQQMSDSIKKKCPQCSKLKLKRLIGSGAGVMFKGSGFYETDYRSASYQKDKKAAESNSSTEKSKKQDSQKESKSNTPKPEKD